MISRREFLMAAVATSAMVGGSGFGKWSRLAAQQALREDDILGFQPLGNVTHRHSRAAEADLFPRAVDQSRRR
jgi:sulfur-oxidizing protein SoxB